MRARVLAVVAVLALVAAACTSSGDDGGGFLDTVAGTDGGGDGNGGTQAGGGGGDDGGGDRPGTDAMQPGPLFQGLANYDSYRMTLGFEVSGPEVDPVSASMDVEYSAAEGGWRTVLTADDGFEETSQEIYWRGGVGCAFDGFEWGPLEFGPGEQDLFGALWAGFDFVLRVRDPELVGEETYAGVAANHYRASVVGLGASSGAVPQESTIDYWKAQDGGALLGYRANVSALTGPAGDPNTQEFSLVLSMETSDLDSDVAISPPPECPAGAPAPGGGRAATGEVTVLPGIAETLGAYDSYRLSMTGDFGSPSLGGAAIDMTISVARGGSFEQVISVASEGDFQRQSLYWDGETLCQYDGASWTAEDLAAEQSELGGALGQQLDFAPVVIDAEAIGPETISGVSATRYKFPVAGMAPGSGTMAEGEYYLSEDGQLLRYEVFLSGQAQDGTEIDGEIVFSLDDLNADIEIVLPPECDSATVIDDTTTADTTTTTAGDSGSTTGVDASGAFTVTGAFESQTIVNPGDLNCYLSPGVFEIDYSAENGFTLGGIIFDLDQLTPGEYEFDDIFALGPFGTPAGDSGEFFERFLGGPGVASLIVSDVSGDSIAASISAELRAEGFDPAFVGASFSCTLQ